MLGDLQGDFEAVVVYVGHQGNRAIGGL